MSWGQGHFKYRVRWKALLTARDPILKALILGITEIAIVFIVVEKKVAFAMAVIPSPQN